MTKKQKKLLQRITAAAVLFAAGMLLPLFAEIPAYIIFALFGISYIIIGWDIIWKAFCNIRQGEAFDENFLMANIPKALPLCCFTRLANGSRAMPFRAHASP